MDNIFKDIGDFLAFRSLITPYALIIFYYLGALGMPFAAWLFIRWMRLRIPYFAQTMVQGAAYARATIKPQHRLLLGLMFLCCFLMMELFWRMMFEFMLTYFEIHKTLTLISHGGSAY